MEKFTRTESLIGKKALEKLRNSNVIVFGIGGVGSYVCEALVRGGIGKISLVDNDVVCKSNINRQLIALNSSLGKPKVTVMAERIKDINPDCVVTELQCFYSQECCIDLQGYDYIVDAIDTVTSKLLLAEQANVLDIPIISSMGTGNKLDPTQFEIADIYDTSVCPLARVMRRELKQRGIKRLKVLYSKEQPLKPLSKPDEGNANRHILGSISFVPSTAGLIIAGEVIKDLTGINKKLS